MPPVSPIAVSCLSVRFRECGLKACALECVATRGALLIAATSQNPRSLRCDRSIKILNRLQAPTFISGGKAEIPEAPGTSCVIDIVSRLLVPFGLSGNPGYGY